MLDVLNFVRGAVSTKDLVPALSHFYINNGRIQGQNGRVVIDAPCPELANLQAVVPADKFLRAVDHCGGSPTITSDGEKLKMKQGKFSATLKLLPFGDYPAYITETELPEDRIKLSGLETMLYAFLHLADFVSTDASRPWSCSVLFRGTHAYATDNVSIARVDVDWNLPDLCIPDFAIKELVRIAEIPVRVVWSLNYCRFEYENGAWLVTRLFDTPWPDLKTFDTMLEANTPLMEITPDMHHAIEKLSPFFPDAKMPVVMLSDEGFSTMEGDSQAAVWMPGMPLAAFRVEALKTMFGHALQWNPTAYPAPVAWRGQGIRGLMTGVRLAGTAGA